MSRLDPKNDLVFKLLLTRSPALLVHMLEGILGRRIVSLKIVDPRIPGQLAADKVIVLDIRAVLADGTRVDVEIQLRHRPDLAARLVYYAARTHADQLRRGDGYHRLMPTVGIVWLLEPMFPSLDRLHSIFELREGHSSLRFSDHLSIHLLQLTKPHTSVVTRYDARVERWARFFLAETDAEFDQLASEDPMMHLAQQTLDLLSSDSETHRRAIERAESMRIYAMSLAESEKRGRDEGEARGEVRGQAKVLLKLLGLRFGAVPDDVRARVQRATSAQLDAWVERVLEAETLDDVLEP